MNFSARAYVTVVLSIAVIFTILQLSEPAYHMPHIPPHISQLIWTVFIISGIALLFFYLQPKWKEPAETTVFKDVLKGKIVEYHTNRIGDIDKLLIDTRQQKYWVHFPPHAAKSVMKTAPKNEMAELTINPSHNKTVDKVPMFELISVRTTSAFFLVESLPLPAPAAGKKIELTGKAGHYKLDEKGIVAGIIINNYLVDLPPHLVENILPVIKESVEIIVKGYERNTDEGFINVTGLIVIKPYAISIDKTDYLL